MARLVSDEVGAHRVRLTDVVASASESLKLDVQSILDLLHATERRARVSQVNS